MKAGWTKETVTVTQAHAVGDAVWDTGEYSIIGTGENNGKEISGHYAAVLTQSGNEWRIAMLIGNLNPARDVTGMAAATTASKSGRGDSTTGVA